MPPTNATARAASLSCSERMINACRYSPQRVEPPLWVIELQGNGQRLVLHSSTPVPSCSALHASHTVTARPMRGFPMRRA